MSAMPAEAEPRRAPAAPGLTALSPTALSPTVLSPATVRPRPAVPRSGQAGVGPGLSGVGPGAADTAVCVADPAARVSDPAQHAARLAPRVVVARRPAGLQTRPAGLQTRPAALRLRPVATRTHPVGVRSCSSIPHPSIPHSPAPVAEPPAAVGEPPAATVTVTERLQRSAPSLPARAPAHVRLTRRGRVVLTLAAAATASLAWLAAASGAQAAGHGVSPGAAPQHVSQIVVQPGQTLWSIATQAEPQADPRLVIQRIIAVNKLAGGSIVAGQRLVVPRI